LISQRIFCVSHETPLVPEHQYDYVIGVGDYRPKKGSHISTLDPFWDRMRPVAYGAAGNYVIPRAIEIEKPKAPLTGVFSHRKIVVRTTVGREAVNNPVYREISIEEALELTDDELRPRVGCEFLIGKPTFFEQSVFGHYAECHYAVDLVDYLSIAVQMNVMKPADVEKFSRDTVFIPGGCELGIYPTDWFCETLQKLELLGRVFLDKYADRVQAYDPYQVRAIGFLAERLGSYLLLKELRNRFPSRLPAELIGCLCVIVPAGVNYDGARA